MTAPLDTGERCPPRPPSIGRRDLLRGAVILAPLVTGLGGCTKDDGPATERFQHGIASGDPLPDAVILWTHVTTDGTAAVDADWEIFEDPGLTKSVQKGTAHTD